MCEVFVIFQALVWVLRKTKTWFLPYGVHSQLAETDHGMYSGGDVCDLWPVRFSTELPLS